MIQVTNLHKYIRIIFSFGLINLLLMACSSSGFVLNETSVQKIVMNNSSNFTEIEISLSDVKEGVEFSHLIYNKQKVNVSSKTGKANTVLVKGMVQQGGPTIENKVQTSSNQPNQLVYTLNGKESFIQLNDLNFKPTKIIN